MFQQKLMREGYAVEALVRAYFSDHPDRDVAFQREFTTDTGLYARADAIEAQAGGTALFEIKSSTRVKTEPRNNHLKDACFQTICAERSGCRISNVSIVHLNGDFVRDGDINPAELLEFTDVTERVREIEAETVREIDAALDLLAQDEIDRTSCPCRRKTRANHCDGFSLLNRDIAEPSIYRLPRLSKSRIEELAARGSYSIQEVPRDFPLTYAQREVARSVWSGHPQIDRERIAAFLDRMEHPLHFFDYETFSTAVPMIDGSKPHAQIPVQYSLHILDADGRLSHQDYLARNVVPPRELVEQLREDVGAEGSLVSWHASFEISRNRELARMFPDAADFLTGLNDRMVDLEDIFKQAYVDSRFGGSTSIKKVLPVVCPDLDYSDQDVQDGAAAMEAWQRMIDADVAEADRIAGQLLRYCRLDTCAMVEIYRFLRRLVDSA